MHRVWTISVTIILLLRFSVVSSQSDSVRWYGIEKGVLRSIVSAGGIDMQQTEFFTDWGRRIATLSVIDGLESFNSSTLTISGGNDLVIWQKGKTSAERFERVNPRINWLELTPDIVRLYQIIDLGPEMLDSLDCRKYTLIINRAGQYQAIIYWVHNGIPIQYNNTQMGVGIEQNFLSLEGADDIDPSIFVIPDSIKVIDVR